MSVRMYQGDKPCPGCGRTGKEHPRMQKDGLCLECREKWQLGDTFTKERNLERESCNLGELMNVYVQWYSIPVSKIDWALRRLLKTFSQFDSKYVCGCQTAKNTILGCADSGTSSEVYVLPKVTFETAKELCKVICEEVWALKRERENLEKEMQKRLNKERNDIYNEGVAYGRDLLRQLNNGEITLDDLNKRFERY